MLTIVCGSYLKYSELDINNMNTLYMRVTVEPLSWFWGVSSCTKHENQKAEPTRVLETTHCIWVKVPIWNYDLEPILFTTHSTSKGNGNSPCLTVPGLCLYYIFHGLASDFEKQ